MGLDRTHYSISLYGFILHNLKSPFLLILSLVTYEYRKHVEPCIIYTHLVTFDNTSLQSYSKNIIKIKIQV